MNNDTLLVLVIILGVVCMFLLLVLAFVANYFSKMDNKMSTYEQRIGNVREELTYCYQRIREIDDGLEEIREDILNDEVEEESPYVISREEFYLDTNTNNNCVLTYRENIDELSIPNDGTNPIKINEVELVVGDALQHFGELSGDPNVVYVRNPEFNVDFEVVRITSNDQMV